MAMKTTLPPGATPAPKPRAQSDAAASSSGHGAVSAPMVPQLLEQLMQIARTSALEEMASGFAHELNQPIGAIATFAQTGERMLSLPTPMIQETRDILYLISEEALKAGRGIHSIRNLFRGHDTEKTTCNLADVLGELNPVLHFLAERCGARLHIDVKAGLPPTFIDKLRIQHVIFTLVQNALEAPCDPAVARTVEIGVSSDRYTVITAVRDHGLGVPAHARDQLYRPFFTTKQNGSGLGLASIQAIIEAHEGNVGFNEAEGGGAIFWFTLPVESGAPSE